MLADTSLRRTIPAVDDQDARERTRKLDLLELRKHLDGQRAWKREIADLEKVLADPARTREHENCRELLALAQRALCLSKDQAARCMRVLNLRDDQDEIDRQRATLAE